MTRPARVGVAVIVVLLAPLVLSLATTNASAQASELAEANQLSRRGIELADECRYEEALAIALRVYDSYLTVRGPDDPDTAACVSHMGLLYFRMGRYAEAEQAQQAALRVTVKALGQDNIRAANLLSELGDLYLAMGRYRESESCYQRALRVYAAILGSKDPTYALCQMSFGCLYAARLRYAEADVTLRQALATLEETVGPDSLATAACLSDLSWLCLLADRGPEALTLLTRAFVIQSKVLPKDHPELARTLNGLGQIAQSAGEYEKAERFYLDALSIVRTSLGENHPSYAGRLECLAELRCAQGQLTEALGDYTSAMSVNNGLASRVFAATDRQHRAEFALLMIGQTYACLTLCVELMPEDPQARQVGLQLILTRKGWLLDSEGEQQRTARVADDPRMGELMSRLRKVRGELAGMAYTYPSPQQRQAYGHRWDELTAQRYSLEAELARQSSEYLGLLTRAKADVAAVAAALPPDSALVEIAKYTTRNFRAIKDEPEWGEERYAAYILRPGSQDPACVSLGNAAQIDAAVRDYRKAFDAACEVGERSAALMRSGRALYDLVWQPLENHLTGLRRVVVSPDGDLNLVPFGALPVPSSGKQEYLCERYVVALANSGRDLVPVPVTEGTGALLVGDPDFRAAATSSTILARAPGSALPGEARQLLVHQEMAPLPGTREEVQSVAERLRAAGVNPQVLLGETATEAAVKSAASPRYLHLATHGFFLPDVDAPLPTEHAGGLAWQGVESGRGTGLMLPSLVSAGTDRAQTLVLSHNPMHRSGLLLAGAQQALGEEDPPEDQEDGVLTAEEVVGLDLQGTRLVVLSACDTGLGQVFPGEGVMGLRRAFSIAGAQALVMSLSKVPDEATRVLMVDFYERYLASGDAAVALTEAQREMLAAQRAAGTVKPWEWGAFVVCAPPGR